MSIRDARRWISRSGLALATIGLAGGAMLWAAQPAEEPPPQGKAALASPAGKDADSPLYLLTYDHGGLVLWGSDHFAQHLHSAARWLDRYPGFKIGPASNTLSFRPWQIRTLRIVPEKK